jgi:site-specific DNA recombinase
MKKAIIYTRVSTDEQAQSGYSLDHQRNILEQYCRLKGMQIETVFVENGYSAKNFDRPEWNRLMHYLKANKKSIDCIVFTKWDRFSRNIEEALTVIRKLQDLGVEIVCMEQPLDLSVPDNKIILSIYLTVPQVENEKNSQRTKEGMRQAQADGFWMGKAPFGYKNIRDKNGKPTIEPDDKAAIVIESFNMVSTGLYSCEEARRTINKKWNTRMCKQSFLDMFNRSVYKGEIVIKEWKKDERRVVQGIHEPLVSKELYRQVQDVLNGRKKQAKFNIRQSDFLPLRGHLICFICGGNITGSCSTGRGGVKHHYYHCQRGCNVRFRADSANREFLNHLSSMKISPTAKNEYAKVIGDMYKQKESEKSRRINHLQEEMGKIVKRIESSQDMMADKQISIEDYKKSKERYDEQMSILQNDLSQIKIMDDNFIKYMRFTLLLIEKIDLFYDIAPLEIKRKLLVSVFPEKLTFDTREYRTTKTNEVISAITNKANILGVDEKKRADISVGSSKEGWPMGLEPTTLGTTNRYSNQLNYGHHLILRVQRYSFLQFFNTKWHKYLQN